MPNAAQRNAMQQKSVTAAAPATNVTDERALPNRVQLANINNKMPPFPCVAVVFSKVPGNTAHEVLRFSDQITFDHYRAMSIGAVRVVLHQSDLADVPTPVLLMIFNRTRADTPLDRFRDRTTAESRVFEVVNDIATPYEESKMAEDTQTEAKTKAEAKANERKAAKEAKKAEKEKAKAERQAQRGNGVIGTIRSMIDSVTGASQSEILDTLVEKFPDRTRDGMSSTVKIQSSRLGKTLKRKIVSANIVGRGRVYKFEDKGPIPGKVIVDAPAAETPAEPKAKPELVVENGAGKGKGAAGKGKGAAAKK